MGDQFAALLAGWGIRRTGPWREYSRNPVVRCAHGDFRGVPAVIYEGMGTFSVYLGPGENDIPTGRRAVLYGQKQGDNWVIDSNHFWSVVS